MELDAVQEYRKHQNALNKRLEKMASRPPKTLFKDIFHRLRFKEYREIGDNVIILEDTTPALQKQLNFEDQDIMHDN